MENKERDILAEMHKQSRDEELLEIIGKIFAYSIVCGISGYVGYKFSIEDGSADTLRYIVFGALVPFWFYNIYEKIIKKHCIGLIGSLIIYGVFMFFYYLICSSIPIYVGFIIFAIIIAIPIIEIIDVNNIYKNRMGKPITENEFKEETDQIASNSHKIDISKSDDYTDILQDEEEYYCERCDKRISQEEYEEYAGLCEECDEEVYFGERYEDDDFDMFR